MGMSHLARFSGAVVLVAAWSGSAQIPALAEPSGDAIVVEAPRNVPVSEGTSPYSGAPIAVTTVKISVLFGDLDLSNQTDGERLMTRINRVAQDACGYLDRLYPLNPDPDCVNVAVAKARTMAKAEIAAAAK